MAIPISEVERKLRRMKAADELVEMLDEVRGYMESRADQEDRPGGGQRMNEEARFAHEIREVLTRAGAM